MWTKKVVFFFFNFKRSCLVILFCQWAGLDSSTLALSCYEFSDVCLWITGDSLWKWKHQRQFKALFSIRALFVLEFISRDPVCASVMWGHQSGQKLPPETNLILFIASLICWYISRLCRFMKNSFMIGFYFWPKIGFYIVLPKANKGS